MVQVPVPQEEAVELVRPEAVELQAEAACPVAVEVAYPVLEGSERSFSCLCVDPCGSPLNGWKRMES